MRHIAVIGLGNFGSTVARALTDRGAHVVAIDRSKERVEDLKESVSYAVALDTVNADALKAIAIQDVDVAVVCIGQDIEANLLTTLLLKKLGVKKIWARAISPLQQEILRTMEIDEIINLEEDMGRIVAGSLASANVTRNIPLSEGHSLAEVKVPESFVGKTLQQIAPQERFRVNVVAVIKRIPRIDETGRRTFEEAFEEEPSRQEPLDTEDMLVVIGSDGNIQRFAES